jgi:hypothetical protein
MFGALTMKLVFAFLLSLMLILTACGQGPAPQGELPTAAVLDSQSGATPTPETMSAIVGGAQAAVGTTETRSLAAFSAVVQNLAATLSVSIGNEPSVEITADPAVLPQILSNVAGDVLELRLADGAQINNAAIAIRVTVPVLRALTINGASTVMVSPMVAETLQIDLNGVGDITLQPLTAQAVTLNVAGTGTVTFQAMTVLDFAVNIPGTANISAAGNIETLTLTASGGGELRAGDLFARAATMDIGGSLNAFVNVMQQLDVTMAGSGSVQFNGTPQVNANVTGGGRVVDSAGNVVAGG